MIKVETFKNENQILNIYYHECPESPREWYNIGTMACKNRRYNLGDEQIKGDVCDWLMGLMDFTDGQVEWWERKYGVQNNNLIDALLKNLNKKFYWLPLYLYDHSGISISTGSFVSRANHAEWDSGMVGIIYVKKDNPEVSSLKKEKILEILKSEVEIYDQYVRGDVYGYICTTIDHVKVQKYKDLYEYDEVPDKDLIELGEQDSCWGFYGTDWETNGLFDNAGWKV